MPTERAVIELGVDHKSGRGLKTAADNFRRLEVKRHKRRLRQPSGKLRSLLAPTEWRLIGRQSYLPTECDGRASSPPQE